MCKLFITLFQILEGNLQLAFLCCPLNSSLRLDWNVLEQLLKKLSFNDRQCANLLEIDSSLVSSVVMHVGVKSPRRSSMLDIGLQVSPIHLEIWLV